jgi:hypothetical protein
MPPGALYLEGRRMGLGIILKHRKEGGGIILKQILFILYHCSLFLNRIVEEFIRGSMLNF